MPDSRQGHDRPCCAWHLITAGHLQGAAGNHTTQTGLFKLGLSTSGRDGYLFVPAGYDSSKPHRLLLVMHAAGKGGLSAIHMFFEQARASGAALIKPPACLHLPTSSMSGCQCHRSWWR